MLSIFRILSICSLFFISVYCYAQTIDAYVTTSDQASLLQHSVVKGSVLDAELKSAAHITVTAKQSFQEIDGFGYTLTGGSADLIFAMAPDARRDLISELFGSGNNDIGVSYLRLSLGASDLSAKVFSYNDLAPGEKDLCLHKFSIAQEQKTLIPVLKEILEVNPNIKLMASPWSPPTWMKTNNNAKGGQLIRDYYAVYALYFVKYIKAMAQEGIIIDAVTIQNEPLHDGNNPSLYMTANEQAQFIKNHLGPAFKQHKIDTKIIIYDHNADRADYPLAILNDPEAKQYADGTAFHLYGGEIEAMSLVHEQHPDKNIYFTEQWVGAPQNFPEDIKWHVRELIIGATRNWSRTVLEWNLANNPESNPHTVGGCDRCLGAITIDGNEVKRNVAYYVIAHASKFVRPGATRIASTEHVNLPNVAFKTEADEIVLIVLNDSSEKQSFYVNAPKTSFSSELEAGAIASYVIKPDNAD